MYFKFQESCNVVRNLKEFKGILGNLKEFQRI